MNPAEMVNDQLLDTTELEILKLAVVPKADTFYLDALLAEMKLRRLLGEA